MDTPDDAPRWATKIAALLREDLQPWQALDVTAFLVSGTTATGPELIGEPYEDADGTPYLPMLRRPGLVLAGAADLLGTARTRALDRGCGPPSSPPTSSPPPVTCGTGQPCARWRARGWTWSGWRCTARGTPSTRS